MNEQIRRQQLLNNVNNLTFSVLKQIKNSEKDLLEKILKDLLKTNPIGKHYKKVKKHYYAENTNNYKLFYDKDYLGDVFFEVKKEVFYIEFIPSGRN